MSAEPSCVPDEAVAERIVARPFYAGGVPAELKEACEGAIKALHEATYKLVGYRSCPMFDGPRERLEAALASAASGRAGYQLVPEEPTEAMLDAYWRQAGESVSMRERVHASARRYWQLFLAAAPPPTPAQTTEGEQEARS